MKRVRGGLESKAHGLVYHSTFRLESNKEEEEAHHLNQAGEASGDGSGDTTPCRMTDVTLHKPSRVG